MTPWWKSLDNSALTGDAAKITLTGDTRLLGNAEPAIKKLLARASGQGCNWIIHPTDNDGLIFIRETDGRINVSTTTIKERKNIDEFLESWNGNVGKQTKNEKFRLDLQSYTRDKVFVNLQRNELRSGSSGRQQGGGGNSSSTTVAQIFIPTQLVDELTKKDKIAAFKASMDNKKAVVLTLKVN
ncbi:hypothetical protein TCAL_11910 [Tigriopus californicus]|uniref:Uncharacterized protein n=1 Tax=Tigriopus californicus TaxID=6832 RepID=A0A553PLC6_TIGCA|nr:uncharacterized protein LOC131890148 isoform X2 [Tigriopus californicus]TRY78462.1 hypothetical protein TCAL_11910 [Tigriopus californicus]